MKNILGNSIRELRKSKKMTQVELAQKTGYKQNTISNHENGNRQLDEQDILTYAEALEVEPQMLFDLSRPSTPKNATDSLLSDLTVDIDAITWLLENATAYAISNNCGLSTQAVDKYKNGTSDIMNMRLKHAINMTSYAHTLQKQ